MTISLIVFLLGNIYLESNFEIIALKYLWASCSNEECGIIVWKLSVVCCLSFINGILCNFKCLSKLEFPVFLEKTWLQFLQTGFTGWCSALRSK